MKSSMIFTVHHTLLEDKINQDKKEGHVVHMGENRNICMVLVGKPGGKRPLGRPKHNWMLILN